MSKDGLWKQLASANLKIYNTQLPTCEGCDNNYWPVRSHDVRPFCNDCNENFKKFCKAQKKAKLVE
jgi:hypothetical protein